MDNRRYIKEEILTIAIALYEIGWRAEDYDWTYTKKELDQICERLRKFAEQEIKEEDI